MAIKTLGLTDVGLSQDRFVLRGTNPLSVPNLSAWWDASVPGSITLNGSNVSQWDDISGNGKVATQANAAKQPFYSSTESLGGIRVGDTTNVEALATDLLFNGEPRTMYLVFRRLLSVPNAFGNVNFVINGVSGFSTYVAGWSDDGWVAQVRDSAGGTPATTGGSLDTSRHVLRLRGTSSVIGVKIDGNAEVTAAHSRNTSSLAQLVGLGPNATLTRANAWIHEVIFYERDVNTDENARIENYLRGKWGI